MKFVIEQGILLFSEFYDALKKQQPIQTISQINLPLQHPYRSWASKSDIKKFEQKFPYF